MGLMPHEFWALTYEEFVQMAKGYNRKQKQRINELMCLAWHTAALSRAEKMPNLDSLLQDADNESCRDQTDDEMMAMAKMLNAAFGGEVVEL